MSVKGRLLVEALETRQMLTAEHPMGINFNDEMKWDTQFDAAVSQAKAAGVSAVRVWVGFDSYDQRPNAWDALPAYGTPGVAWNDSAGGNAAGVMKAIFKLAHAGFSVMLTTNPNNGITPAGPDQVKGWIRHLMDATETPDSTETLADVVDYWEIGNEPDSGGYWAPSGVNKTNGLRSYVDNFLIPAAEELHSNSASPFGPEKVVSGGVSYSPADLHTILDELNAKNAIGDIDYVGFHPYGTFNPADPSAGNQPLTNTLLAKSHAGVYGKSLMATEWNVRGFSNTGANDAQWNAAIDYEYRNVILPNYSVAYYFALANNWPARGGSISARPGGLLTHVSLVAVTPSSSAADLAAYYNSPMVRTSFFNTFAAWQNVSVSGTVTNTNGGATPSSTLYLDRNNNGQLDDGEPSATTDAAGRYTIVCSIATITPGTYTIRLLVDDSATVLAGTSNLDLQPLATLTNVNFSVAAGDVVTPVSTLGSVSGTLWLDANNDKQIGAAETLLAGWTVYLDLNGNNVFDDGDLRAVTDSAGNYTIAYDTALLTVGTAALRVSTPGNFAVTTPISTISLTNTAQTGFQTGVYNPPGSISGFLWSDDNNDASAGDNEARLASRVVFIDTNRNGKLDGNERQTMTDASGNYSFGNLSAGIYYVGRVFPTGYRMSNSTTSYLTVTVAAGQNAAGVNLGATNQKPVVVPPVVVPVVPPVVVPPVIPPVVSPVVPPPAVTPVKVGTASISGTIFARVGSQTKSLLATGLNAFIDANNNGKLDAGEQWSAVDVVTGSYTFSKLAAGTYNVALSTAIGWSVSTPGSKSFVISLTTGRVKTGQNFVVQKA